MNVLSDNISLNLFRFIALFAKDKNDRFSLRHCNIQPDQHDIRIEKRSKWKWIIVQDHSRISILICICKIHNTSIFIKYCGIIGQQKCSWFVGTQFCWLQYRYNSNKHLTNACIWIRRDVDLWARIIQESHPRWFHSTMTGYQL